MTALASPLAPAAPRTRPRADAVTVLTVYLALLLLVPSDRVVPGLGNLGAPATLWGFGCFVWWCWHVLSGRRVRRRLSPVVIAAFVFAGAVLVAYIEAMLRAVPAAEVMPADRNLLRMVSYLGVLLVAADGIDSFERLTVLLRRFAVMATIVALIGILEFSLRTPIVPALSIPGLTSTGGAGGQARGDFLRPAATATHPLEYAATLAAAFPIALALGLRGRGRARALALACSAVLATALVLAGSRSSILGFAIACVPMLFVLTRRERVVAAVAAVVGVVAVYVTVPGMLGTLRHSFTSMSTDSSVLSRTDSWDTFGQLLPLHPWTGRGLGTLLPTYRIFDNQLLTLVLEIGVLGTLAFVGVAIVAVIGLLRRASDPRGAAVSAALIASCIVLVVLSGFFDSFSFAKSFGLLALAPGLCAAAARVIPRAGAAGIGSSSVRRGDRR